MPTIAREMGDGKRRVGEREESEREWWSREPERGDSKHDSSMDSSLVSRLRVNDERLVVTG